MYTRYPSLLALPLAGLGLFASQALADCESYGIDFVNNGDYFINVASDADFTCVTQFTGCQNDTADVILEDPSGDYYTCSSVPLLPDSTPELSTCDIEKSQMVSGEWYIQVLSNNGDGNPLANIRSFSLDVGTQQTVTATPTLLFNYTTTPTITATTTNWVVSNVTVPNNLTVTSPSATDYVTVTPTDTVTITNTKTLTRTFKTWVRTSTVYTITATPSCTVPPRPQQPDPPITTWPANFPYPRGFNKPSRRDADVAMDPQRGVRARFAIRDLARAQAVDKRNMAKRSADAATVTTTETTSTITSTSTFTGTTSTVLDIEVSTTTSYTTDPPSTVYYGEQDITVTAPTPTETDKAVTTTYTWSVGTITAKHTQTVWVTPTAVVSACKTSGGHFGRGWQGGYW